MTTKIFPMSQNGNCRNNHVNEIKFDLNKFVQVRQVIVRTDQYVAKNDVIFTMIDTNGQRQSFLSPVSGMVTNLYIDELDVLSHGSIILEWKECSHTITFKNLCTVCGIHLNQTNNNLRTSKPVKDIVQMEPSFPAIKIAAHVAAEYDREERQLLLRKRKLHLLVDLDQTLIHTTNSKHHCPLSSDVVALHLRTPVVQTLYTKLRPGVKEFLTNLQSFYQFHIVTFGDRAYANSIVKLIDPHGKFFSHRILSRDECLSLTDKTANLSTLFPCGDSLVCIIDDREDVWKCALNLVQVKSYAWFQDVGDINLPTLIATNDEQRKSYKESDEILHMQTSMIENSNVVDDSDCYLHQLELILKRIHTTFYNIYDQSIQDKLRIIPDLKQIMPDIRRQILSSVSLCFSSMMPQDYPLEQYRGTIMAQAMGAKVTRDLQFYHNGILQTTHVIAGKQTYKVYQALQSNIKVVTPEWLIDCYEQWEKKTEDKYLLTNDYDVRKCYLFTETIARVSKRPHDDIEQRGHAAMQSVVNQQHNCAMTIDERVDKPTEAINICTADNTSTDDVYSRPSKRQCSILQSNTVIQKRDDYDDEDINSLYNDKLYKLVLGKSDDDCSDDENLSDDEAPRGWKENHKRKQ